MEGSRTEEILMKVALSSFWFIIIFTFTGLAILLVYKGEIALILIICGMVAFIVYAGFKLIWKYKRPVIELNVQGEPCSIPQELSITSNRQTIEPNYFNNSSNQTIGDNIFNSGTRPEILLQPHLLPRNIYSETSPPDYYSVIDGRSANLPKIIIDEKLADDSLPSYQEALCIK